MKGYMKVKIIETHFGQKLRFIFMMRDRIFVMTGLCFIMNGLEFHDGKSDFHNDRSRFHLFVPGVTQGKEDVE